MPITLGEQEIDGRKYGAVAYGDGGEVLWAIPIDDPYHALSFHVMCKYCGRMSNNVLYCEKCGERIAEDE